MTPNKLADALSDEAMLASKRAQVLRALDYSDEAAILRDTVADELDRQSVRLMRMFAMALPDDPIADPAGDELKLRVQYCRVYEALLKEYPDSARDVREYVDFLATERMRLWEESRLARSQRQCGCGLDTCKESWEPGCGLGTSVEHAVPVEPQRQWRAAGVYQHLRSIRYNAENGSQDRPAWKRLEIISKEASEAMADIEQSYTEQPASAAAAVLIEIRELLASKPVDCLGSGVLDYGQTYPIRDEVIDRITKVLAAAPDRSQSGGGA